MMELGYNPVTPRIMHIDLNSCFATIEQQANRRQRGRPVAVAAYDHPNGIILAASYEAKALGIALGTKVKEAKAICPDIYIVEPDPPKYREAHRRFREVLERFTSDVTPKSIDEFVVNLTGSPAIMSGKTMKEIGYNVKAAVHEHVGEAVNCNVGIAPNRFLAKLAAGLHKPDGLDIITAENLEPTLAELRLTDLPGINRRFSARLKLAGIYTPLEFLAASRQTLVKQVFHGIVGHYWWLRLRGWEIDDKQGGRRTIGHQYAIPRPERTPEKVAAILAKLSEKTGRRLREKQWVAHGIHLGVRYADYTHWGQSMKAPKPLYATSDIFHLGQHLLARAPKKELKLLSIGVHDFAPAHPEQLSFFDGQRNIALERQTADAMDKINNTFGEYVVLSATMLGVETAAKDAIAFGKLDEVEASTLREAV
ncbi:MAG TPA: hypothetical protein VFZ58_05610 [Candidatus Saccharimonadales bacterium]